MIYLQPLPTDPATLIALIGARETHRERLRALGHLTSEHAQRIAQELRELRSQLALVQAKARNEAA